MKHITKIALLICIISLQISVALSEPTLKNLGPAPIFKAQDENNQTLSNANFIGKYLIINFFFTSCQGPCPALMEFVNKLSKDFPNTNLEFISFSVDPEIDTDTVLKKYKEQHGLTDPRIHLVRTSEDEIIHLLNNGFKLGSGGDTINHSTRFVLIDKMGQIRMTYSGDYQGLKEHVELLLKK